MLQKNFLTDVERILELNVKKLWCESADRGSHGSSIVVGNVEVG